MSEEKQVTDALKEIVGELKTEILQAVDEKLAVVKTEAVKEEEEVEVEAGDFDPNKPRAVRRKVRCVGPKKLPDGTFSGESKQICGSVYLRIMENADNPTPGDVRCTHKTCPTCGSEKFEELVEWELDKPNGLNVKIKRTSRHRS